MLLKFFPICSCSFKTVKLGVWEQCGKKQQVQKIQLPHFMYTVDRII
jgi:hypothetical protein